MELDIAGMSEAEIKARMDKMHREAAENMSEEEAERIRAAFADIGDVVVVTARDIARCPKLSWSPRHYYPGGTCKCADHERYEAEVLRCAEALRCAREEQASGHGSAQFVAECKHNLARAWAELREA